MTNICENERAERTASQQACSVESDPMSETKDIALASVLDRVEVLMLNAPQIECPVVHHFGGGIYIREIFIPAGTYALGHTHKKETMSVLLRGKMVIFVNDEAKVIEAPFIFASKPGRKLGYALEDCVFQNIHPTDKTDLAEIEEEFVEKSEAWTEKQSRQLLEMSRAVQKHFEEA